MEIDIDNIVRECVFLTSRSGGAGGQHVNKVETKVTLKYNIADSTYLNDQQKTILLDRLSNRINKAGQLVLHEESDRSQLNNREKIIKKLIKLLTKSLEPEKKRKVTKVPKEVIESRIKNKKHKSDIKDNRKKPDIF